jgi:hypothetical protein
MTAKTKKTSTYFESLQYTLYLYYCPGIQVEELFDRLCARNRVFKQFANTDAETFASVFVPDPFERAGHLLVEDDMEIGILHHEIIHVTTHAFQLTGSDHTEETDELYAYHSQLFFENTLRLLLTKFKLKISGL